MLDHPRGQRTIITNIRNNCSLTPMYLRLPRCTNDQYTGPPAFPMLDSGGNHNNTKPPLFIRCPADSVPAQHPVSRVLDGLDHFLHESLQLNHVEATLACQGQTRSRRQTPHSEQGTRIRPCQLTQICAGVYTIHAHAHDRRPA
jgi:hypothetical protein